jgi:hypothetical protein
MTATKKTAKFRISSRAAKLRIGRVLRRQHQCLRKDRNTDSYFVVDLKRNSVMHFNVELTQYGQEIGALQKWEEVGDG